MQGFAIKHDQPYVYQGFVFYHLYPENHLGTPVGEVDLTLNPEMKYHEKPQHDWEMDRIEFNCFGLKEELLYTNIARSLKENVYSFTLETKNSKLEVFSDGIEACQFVKIDGKNTLNVNDCWDYNCLLRGNYQKLLTLEKEKGGRVVFSAK